MKTTGEYLHEQTGSDLIKISGRKAAIKWHTEISLSFRDAKNARLGQSPLNGMEHSWSKIVVNSTRGNEKRCIFRRLFVLFEQKWQKCSVRVSWCSTYFWKSFISKLSLQCNPIISIGVISNTWGRKIITAYKDANGEKHTSQTLEGWYFCLPC